MSDQFFPGEGVVVFGPSGGGEIWPCGGRTRGEMFLSSAFEILIKKTAAEGEQ